MAAEAAPPAPVPAPDPADWRASLEPILRAAAQRLVRVAVPAVLAGAASLGTYLGCPQTRTVEVPVQSPAPLVDSTPLDYEGHRFDGGDHDHHAHPLAAPLPARWPTSRVTYSIDYASARGLNPPLADAAIGAAFRQATGWWAESLDLDFVEVPAGTAAMIPVTFSRIDGPQGVLAQAYLADGTSRPKPLTMDSSERWTAGPPAAGLVSIPTVACHELGHSLGLDHDAPAAPAVMRPTYTSAIPREQARDIDRMVALGYRRRAKAPPPATDLLSFPATVKTDDVIGALRNAGYTVTK